MAGAVFRVFVVGAVSLTPIKQNKTLAKIFSEALARFAEQKRLWPKFCIIFCDFNFDILLTVLVVFHFCFFIFCWGFISLKILVNIINKYFYCPLFSSKSLNAFGIGIDFLSHHFLNLNISNLLSSSVPTSIVYRSIAFQSSYLSL